MELYLNVVRQTEVGMKRCSQCKEMLNTVAFHQRWSQRDGLKLRPECMVCRAGLNQAYWAERILKRDVELEAYRTPTGYRLEEVRKPLTEEEIGDLFN